MNTKQDRYPLFPLQQGMLFNSLYAPDSGVDVMHLICTLHHDVESVVLERAWQRIVEQHPILRTSFCWEGLAEPVQEVHQQVELLLERHDWRGLSVEDGQARLEDYLLADRQRGFDLTRPPLVRIALFQIDQAEYYFVLTFHHILIDGRSLRLILKQSFALYEALCQGQDLELAQPRPYKDYITWLRRQDLSKDEPFWRDVLDGFTTPISLAAGAKDTSPTTAGHADESIRLPLDLASKLRSLAKEHRLTLNTFVQGAWALLLSRYSGQDDVVFGAIRSCRRTTIEGADSIMGLLINTLPVRARISPETPLLAWLKELRAQSIAVRDHQLTPLAQIQGWSEVPKGTLLFDTIVAYENFLLHNDLRAQGSSWNDREFRLRRQPNYPLSLCVFAEQEPLIHILYDHGRFDRLTIVRMLGHFRTLLEEMAANLDRRLADISLLTETERLQLLEAWNATQADYPRDTCVHHLFEAQVERAPDAVALVCDTERLTYRQLDQRANQLAHHLRALGVGPEVRVATCIERSPELVIGQLAILKAGGAFVSLDPTSPGERLSFMLRDAQSPVLLTQERLAIHLPGIQTICLDGECDFFTSAGSHNPASYVTPANLAYVIYTSGSTGQPKGVEIQHAGLVNLTAWHRRTYALTPTDRSTQLASPAFDASVWEIWPVLTAGASLYFPSEEIRSDSLKLVEWLAARAITVSFLPTALAEAAIEHPWPKDAPLRALLVGGDQLHQPPPEGLPFDLYNHYGPTEDTVVTTVTKVKAGPKGEMLPSIGGPMDNTQVYVLDSTFNQVPVGVPGELFIGGDGLARGYLNRPALTAERFVPNPFHRGSRLYRTGDLVRHRPDGKLDFMGRIDHQVKIRGFRIELGEIEASLTHHPAVADAVVLARTPDGPSPGPGKYLAAYAVPSETPPPDASELRCFLKERLPDYMLPSVFVMLDTLPLTSSGKVDRRALPDPDFRSAWQARYTAPRTLVEELLVGIWAEVLGLEHKDEQPSLGIHDSFFELGGHSLSATRAIHLVHQVFRVELSLRTLFEMPTVAEFSEHIQEAKERRSSIESPAIVPLDRNHYRAELVQGKAYNS